LSSPSRICSSTSRQLRSQGGWPEIELDRLDDGPVVTVLLNEAGGKTELVCHLACRTGSHERDGVPDTLRLEPVQVVGSPGVTHVKYRVG
jgi:hypothetical protein